MLPYLSFLLKMAKFKLCLSKQCSPIWDGLIVPSYLWPLCHFQFQEFLEGQLSPDNLRIKLERSESTHGFNHMDSEETQEVLTRHDLKKAGQKLIDSKEKPKKKRAKKSK